MKRYKQYLPLLALTTMAVGFTACTDENDNSDWDGSNGIVFTSSITAMQSRASGTLWELNDQVGIYMTSSGSALSSALASNQLYTANTNGKLTATNKGLTYPASGNVDFVAYYPYQSSVSNQQFTWDISDQSTPSKLTLLYSNNATNIASGNNVHLTFAHKMSQIILDIEHDATLTSTKGIAVKVSNLPTTGTFDLTTGNFTSTSTPADFSMLVNSAGTTASAIVFPTTDAGGTTLTFTYNDEEFSYTFPAGTAFGGGYKVSYKANISLTNGKYAVQLSGGTITDWTDKDGGSANVDFTNETTPTTKTLLSETFEASIGAFTVTNIVSDSNVVNVWKHDATNKYMKATAYVSSKRYATEARLESPEIDLTSATKATLTFDHVSRYTTTNSPATELTLQVKEKGTATWTTVTIPTYSSGTNWTFVSSGDIDLSPYKGKTIQIGFLYKSTTTIAPTWEIKNVKIVGDGNSSSSGGNTGGGSSTAVADTIFKETFGTTDKTYKIAEYSGWDNQSLTFVDEGGGATVRKTKTLDTHVYFTTNTATPSSTLKISGFTAAGYTQLTLSYKLLPGKAGDANTLPLYVDGTQVTVPSTPLAANAYGEVKVTIPQNATTIEFKHNIADVPLNGVRLDDIILIGTK